MNLPLSRLLGAAYYIEKFGEVEGWLDPTTALAMMELLWEQERRGLTGNIAEIGIHHGLSFLALAAGAAEGDTLFAIDLFDDQGQNVDGSGQGNERIFRRNLDRFFPQAHVEIVRGSSLLLRGKEAEHGLTELRFLSIDGGHTREITLNDLRIAETALAPHGIACVDDIYSSHWPGVISAVCDFLRGDHQLVPFCFLPNKLFLCRPAFAGAYTAFLRYAFFAALEKAETMLFDYSVDVYGSRAVPFTQAMVRALGEGGEIAAPTRNDAATAQLNAVLNSRTWRWTAPIRRLAGLVRGSR